jgi:Uma2 family endonuclease
LEVLSPSTARKDRVLKLPRYHAAGVEYAWLLDPLNQTLEVFRRQPAGWLVAAAHAGKVKVRAEPFEAIELELGELWPWAEDDPPGESA